MQRNYFQKMYVAGLQNPMQYYLDICKNQLINKTFSIQKGKNTTYHLKLTKDLVLMYDFKPGDVIKLVEKNGRLISWKKVNSY